MALAGVLQKTADPAGVIVMAMAQDEEVGGVDIDAQFPGVTLEFVAGPCVEKDLPAVNLDPHGQAVLFLKAIFNPVVYQYLQTGMCHLVNTNL